VCVLTKRAAKRKGKRWYVYVKVEKALQNTRINQSRAQLRGGKDEGEVGSNIEEAELSLGAVEALYFVHEEGEPTPIPTPASINTGAIIRVKRKRESLCVRTSKGGEKRPLEIMHCT
jgi:hypothetical protein